MDRKKQDLGIHFAGVDCGRLVMKLTVVAVSQLLKFLTVAEASQVCSPFKELYKPLIIGSKLFSI